MFSKIIFYSHFHNGDVHVSRTFVRDIIAQFPNMSYEYWHRNHPDVLKDIKQLKSYYGLLDELKTPGVESRGSWVDSGKLYINTWYCASHGRHYGAHGTTISCLYNLFSELKQYGFNLRNITEYVPYIDFNALNVFGLDEWIKSRKLVFISNGEVNSGQSNNFDMNPTITELANEFPGITFLVSNFEDQLKLDNVIYTRQLIRKYCGELRFDLNENGYLITKSRLVIHRCSGAAVFGINKLSIDNKVYFLSLADSNMNGIHDFGLNSVLPNPLFDVCAVHNKQKMLDAVYCHTRD